MCILSSSFFQFLQPIHSLWKMDEKCKMKRAAFEEWKIKKHNVDVDILISNQVQSVCSARLFSAVAFSFWNLLWYDFCARFCCTPLPHQAQLRDKRNFLCSFSILQLFFFRIVALDLRVEFRILVVIMTDHPTYGTGMHLKREQRMVDSTKLT